MDAGAALRAAPLVAKVLAAELGYSADWIAGEVFRFKKLAEEFYLVGLRERTEPAPTEVRVS